MSEFNRQLVINTLERHDAFGDKAVVFGTGAACLQLAGVEPHDVDVLAERTYFYRLWDQPGSTWNKDYSEPALAIAGISGETLGLNICRRISEHVIMSYESVMERGGVRFLNLADGNRIAYEPIEEVLALLGAVGRPKDQQNLAYLSELAREQGLLSPALFDAIMGLERSKPDRLERHEWYAQVARPLIDRSRT